MKPLRLLLFFLIIICSCNNPLHRTYSPSTYEEDMQAIRKSNKVSDEDLQSLASFIVLAKLSGNDITGKSYDDILDKIKSFQQNNDQLNNKNELEKEARRKRLSPFLEVSLQRKDFLKKGNRQVLEFTITFKNTSSQKIKTISGSLVINDLMEKPIKTLSILLDENILPGQSLIKIYTVDYNDGDENDRRMRVKDIFDMRTVWNPEKIIFEKGMAQ